MVRYAFAGGVGVGLCSFLLFLAAQTCRQISDWWVRQWTSDAQQWYGTNDTPFPGANAGTSYVAMYAILVGTFIILMLCRGSFFHWWTLGASQNLNKRMVHK